MNRKNFIASILAIPLFKIEKEEKLNEPVFIYNKDFNFYYLEGNDYDLLKPLHEYIDKENPKIVVTNKRFKVHKDFKGFAVMFQHKIHKHSIFSYNYINMNETGMIINKKI